VSSRGGSTTALKLFLSLDTVRTAGRPDRLALLASSLVGRLEPVLAIASENTDAAIILLRLRDPAAPPDAPTARSICSRHLRSVWREYMVSADAGELFGCACWGTMAVLTGDDRRTVAPWSSVML